MLFSLAMLTCDLLMRKYPDGYLIDELYEEARTISAWISDPEFIERALLGMENDAPDEHALLACWKKGEDGKIYFDPEPARYSGFANDHCEQVIKKRFAQIRSGKMGPGTRTGD